MIFCPKCGTQNPDGATFCGGCGESLKDRMPAPQAATPAPQAAAPAPQAMPTAQQPTAQRPAAAPAHGGPAVAVAPPRNRMFVLIGIIAVAVIAVLLIVFLALPNCSGGARGGNIDMKTLTNGKASEAQAVLDKMKKGTIDADGEEIAFYASSDKMVDYIQGLYEDAMGGDIKDWDDVMNSKVAKEYSGEWVLVSTADESFEEAMSYVNRSQSAYDMSHMVVYATVVADNDLTNEEVANLVSSAGVESKHAQVVDMKIDELSDFLNEYVGVIASSGQAAGVSSSSMNSVLKALDYVTDELGAKAAGYGAYLGTDEIAISVKAQFEDYAVVLLWVDSPKNIEGLDKVYNEDYLNRIYVK